jgi:hypothetical protein
MSILTSNSRIEDLKDVQVYKLSTSQNQLLVYEDGSWTNKSIPKLTTSDINTLQTIKLTGDVVGTGEFANNTIVIDTSIKDGVIEFSKLKNIPKILTTESSISDLSDVKLSPLTTSQLQVLGYDNGHWSNIPLNTITYVGDPSDGDYLKFNGKDWTPSTIPEGESVFSRIKSIKLERNAEAILENFFIGPISVFNRLYFVSILFNNLDSSFYNTFLSVSSMFGGSARHNACKLINLDCNKLSVKEVDFRVEVNENDGNSIIYVKNNLDEEGTIYFRHIDMMS